MRPKKLINIILRVLLLTGVGIVLILYLFGVALNIAGFGEMRPSDAAIIDILTPRAGDHVRIDTAHFRRGFTSYASVHREVTPDSVAVVFVHGSPGSLDAYLSYLDHPHLQAHASLYAYDRQGFGKTRPLTATRTLEEQSEQLFAFVNKISAKKLILVGHSLGCSIIGKFAIDHPDAVQGLVMVAAPIDPAEEPASWWRPILDFPMLSIAVPRALRASNQELAPLKRDLNKCLTQWPRVTCPVIFIHGDKDELVPVGNVAFGKKHLVNVQAFREVILHDKGHFILWSDVDLIADEIVSLIDGTVDDE